MNEHFKYKSSKFPQNITREMIFCLNSSQFVGLQNLDKPIKLPYDELLFHYLKSMLLLTTNVLCQTHSN